LHLCGKYILSGGIQVNLASLILRKWRSFIMGCKNGSYGVHQGALCFCGYVISVRSNVVDNSV